MLFSYVISRNILMSLCKGRFVVVHHIQFFSEYHKTVPPVSVKFQTTNFKIIICGRHVTVVCYGFQWSQCSDIWILRLLTHISNRLTIQRIKPGEKQLGKHVCILCCGLWLGYIVCEVTYKKVLSGTLNIKLRCVDLQCQIHWLLSMTIR